MSKHRKDKGLKLVTCKVLKCSFLCLKLVNPFELQIRVVIHSGNLGNFQFIENLRATQGILICFNQGNSGNF